jgi:hypothetical protein
LPSTTLVLKEENLVVLENVEKSVYEELQHKAGEENCAISDFLISVFPIYFIFIPEYRGYLAKVNN